MNDTLLDVKRCLLIGPLGFYSFHNQLADGLARRGYRTELLNDEFPESILGRLLGTLALPIIRWSTLRGLRKRLANQDPYDLIVIVKGRGLGRAALAYLRTRARRIVGYNFDSFRYNPSPLDWHDLTDRYATFDIRDAANYGLSLVHLFSAVAASPRAERRYDLSIIQRVHSDRIYVTDQLLKALPSDASVFVFLYESNPMTFLLGVLRHPVLYSRLWRHISFRPLSHGQAMEALSLSRVTFDYAHPRQSGITIRCFEAQSLGVAVLTNNSLAVDSGIFGPGSIAQLPAEASPEDFAALVSQLAQCAPQPRTRTLDVFLDELLVFIPSEEGKSAF